MANMTPESMNRFLAERHLGHLVTVGPSTAPHVAPVWYLFRGGDYLVFASRLAVKSRNLGADARVALSIASEDEPYRGVIVEGTATVSDEGIEELMREISIRYRGAEQGTAFADDRVRDGHSVLITIIPHKTITWDYEGEL